MPRERVDLPYEITHLSILDEDGHVDKDLEPDIPEEDLRMLYRTMVKVRSFDERRLRLQRQGRIGTFAPVKGQEAAQLGAMYALEDTDWLVPCFRETAAAIYRGADLARDLLYAAGYEEGVQIPDDARELPINIPVGSHIPHAAGVAWASKLKGEDDVTIAFFGDGSTSEGDFHEGLNFAGVFQVPGIFVCQNNRYAISVPREQQTKSETIAQKAIAYGVPGMQVDGNDILAVYTAVKEAAERARNGDGPTLIEALTYRLSVHTTADDPTKYRDDEEVEEWAKKDPIDRFRTYLLDRDIITEDEVDAWQEEADDEVADAVKRFEELQDECDDPLDMFEHAYAEMPKELQRQKEQMARWTHLHVGRDH